MCVRCAAESFLNLDNDYLPVLIYDQCMLSCNVCRKVNNRTEAKIIETACEPVFERHSRWTIQLLEELMKVELEEPISRETMYVRSSFLCLRNGIVIAPYIPTY